jgi:hypothetical protein
VYAPAPVYAPVPVYAPRPVYVVPRPVYVAPRVIHAAPVIVVPARYAPRHFGPPARAWAAPRPHGHRDRDDRRDGRRYDPRDRDGYRY